MLQVTRFAMNMCMGLHEPFNGIEVPRALGEICDRDSTDPRGIPLGAGYQAHACPCSDSIPTGKPDAVLVAP